MSCHDIQVLISAYVDGELSDEEYSLISKHLEKCSECQQFYNDLKAITGLFSITPEVEPPNHLRNNVMNQITIATKVKEEKHSNIYRLGWNLRRVAAGLVLFFLSLGIGIYPLIAHNLAIESPFELIRMQSSNDSLSEPEMRMTSEPEMRKDLVDPSDKAAEEGTKTPEEDSFGVMSLPDGESTDDTTNDSEEPMMGIMQVEVQDEAESTTNEEKINEGNFSSLTEDAPIEDKGFVDIVGTPKLILSFAGTFFGILMIWYAKEQK